MAHFAKIENGIVTNVIVISDKDAPDPAPEHSEPLGQAFIRDVLKLEGEWVQTSYNNKFRAQYAGIGCMWDAKNQVFIDQQPYPSWSLDEAWNWVAPVPYPDDGGMYAWNEDTLEWDEIHLEDDGA